MQALIVHCHPEPGSFNAALSAVAVQTLRRMDYEVEVTDLYAQGFDPLEDPRHYSEQADPHYFSALTEQRQASEASRLPADVSREIERLNRADLVVFQFPLWWHAQPAMLKGWFDRVFVYGGLYTGQRRYDRGHFRGRRAICSVTTGAPAPAFQLGGRGGDINTLLWPIHYSLYYMGYHVLPPFVAHGIQGGGLSYRTYDAFTAHLDACKVEWAQHLERINQLSPLPFNRWKDWDEQGAPRAMVNSKMNSSTRSG